jgi:hypothetical protein
MRKKLFLALTMMAATVLGSIVYESALFAQNSNSSTTATNSNSSPSMSGTTNKRRGRRRARRTRRGRRTPKNANM